MGLFKQKVLFTKEECDSILESYDNIPIVGHVGNKHSTYRWINLDKTINRWILDRFIKWIESEVSCKIKWDSNEDRDEFYFQTYEIGDKFNIHHDSVANRIYTAGLLLNDNFEGGNFLVNTHSKDYELFENKIGNCYIIESLLKHQLTEILDGKRRVILIFFKKSQIEFNKNVIGLQKIM
jgi:hypothetical protein